MGDSDVSTALAVPAGMQVGIGALSGWAAGYALRQGGKMFAVLVGGGFIFVQSLAHLGYVQVDWRKAEQDYERVMDRNHDGKVTAADFQIMLQGAENLLKSNLPERSGFVGGLSLGLSGSLTLAAAATAGYVGVTGATLGSLNDLGLEKLADEGFEAFKGGFPTNLEGFKRAGGKLLDGVTQGKDPRLAAEAILNECTIEDLRQIEFEVKNDIPAVALAIGINHDLLPKDELLDAIESAKRVVKSRRVV